MAKTARRVEPHQRDLGSVANALALLDLLRDRDDVRVTEVAEALGVSASSAHRLLATFETHGYVCQPRRHGAYAPGASLTALAHVLGRKVHLEQAARPVLLDLVRELNETAHVAVLRGDQVVFVDCVMPQRRAPASSRKGRALPAYATAAGKVLLADLSRPQIERLYPVDELPRLTMKTLSSRATLLNDLHRVRERGYAVHIEESERRMAAYACPVRDASGAVCAAVVVAGPIERFRTYSTTSIVAALQAAATATATLSS